MGEQKIIKKEATNYEEDVATVLLGMHRELKSIEKRVDNQLGEQLTAVTAKLSELQAAADGAVERCSHSEAKTEKLHKEVMKAQRVAESAAQTATATVPEIEQRLSVATQNAAAQAIAKAQNAEESCRQAITEVKSETLKVHKALELHLNKSMARVENSVAVREKALAAAMADLQAKTQAHELAVVAHRQKAIYLFGLVVVLLVLNAWLLIADWQS